MSLSDRFTGINIEIPGVEDFSPWALIMLPIVVEVAMGLFYAFTASDMTYQIGNGGGFAWGGCVITCTLQPVSIITTLFPPFQSLLSGDFIGFVAGWFTLPQTAVSIFSYLVAIIMLVIGLGVTFGAGGGGSILGTGGSTSFSLGFNDAVTRVAQSGGITLIMFGTVNFIFGTWFGALGFGLGLALQILFFTMVVIGSYLNGKSVTR